jgi:predicted AAA+ superfamily ATPase
VGKTTLLRQLLADINEPSVWLNADEGDVREALSAADTSTRLLQLVGQARLLVIDEAQQIPHIGLKLKLLHDTRPDVQVIATGSSAFELLNKSNEPLTGRKREYQLFPFSYTELVQYNGLLTESRLLHTRLVYGSYPEVVNNPGKEKEVLTELANSYLYKDLLRYEGLQKPVLLQKLLQALAFQVGYEVKYNELAQTIGNIDPATVEKYIDLLEKAYVVYRLPALSRNLRNELKKGKKVYFYDNGIRNVLISNFNAFDLRMDKGPLWENYLLAERMKRNAWSGHTPNCYFWRTHDQAEIDYIEEYDGVLHAYEFKVQQGGRAVRFPKSFLDGYPQHITQVVDIKNYTEFIDMPA